MSAENAKGRWESLRRLIPIVGAVGAGVAIGTYSENTGSFLAPFGTLYLSLLLMCVIPIIGAAVVSSLGRLVANHKLGRNLVVIVLVFWVGMLLAAAIGTSVGWITGVGNDLRSSSALGELLLKMESTSGEGIVGDGGGATVDDRYVELFEGRTTGTPIALLIRNVDQKPKDYSKVQEARHSLLSVRRVWYQRGSVDKRT